MFPVFNPLIELLYVLFFFFNLFAELFSFPCSPVSFGLTPFLLIFLPPDGNSGSHQSGYAVVLGAPSTVVCGGKP
jgi:hypothetical protein